MPPGFAFPCENVDVWRPIGVESRRSAATVGFRRAHWLRAIARLKPGVTARARRRAAPDRRRPTQDASIPATNKYMGAAIMPLHDFLVGDTRLPLLVLLTSVALLLLIACANVGNLLLVQAAGREREAALRLALGAGRSRLVRQALTESLVLSVLGGACGLALGWAGTRALVRLQPAGHAPRARLRRRRARCSLYVIADHDRERTAVRHRAGALGASPRSRRTRSRTAARGAAQGVARGAGATRSSSAKSRSRCS